jgi:hypothetical protein
VAFLTDSICQRDARGPLILVVAERMTRVAGNEGESAGEKKRDAGYPASRIEK